MLDPRSVRPHRPARSSRALRWAGAVAAVVLGAGVAHADDDKAAPAKASPAKTAPAAAKAPSTSPEARALAGEVQRFYAGIEGMQADFTQVVRKRGIKKGLRRKGKVWLKKGRVVPADKPGGKEQVEQGRMRWDYPDEEVFYFSDGDVL